MTMTRSLSYKLYPSPAQEREMEAKRIILKDLWNAALEERIGAWRRGVRVTRSDQEKSLKEIRRDLQGWNGLVHTHEAQGVLKRLDLAFQAFFRRVAAGQTPGFPRFRSADRFRGWSYKEHGNGFKVELGDGGHNGHIRLFGVGSMRVRGRVRTPGRVLKADVVKTVRGWMLNLVVATDCAERAPAEGPAIGLDWGVADFATIAIENGGYAAVPNPRHLAAEAEDLKAEGRKLSAAARARQISGRALRKHRRSLARRHAKVAACRKDFLHKVTTQLAASHRMIVTEELTVWNMTASARGTLEDPGRNVAQKAGLNRSILDTAPATFLNMLRYKGECRFPKGINPSGGRIKDANATQSLEWLFEAGSEFLLAPTRKLKPSQRCPACGDLQKKRLSERIHDCSCGCRLGRDEAAARVMLNHGLAHEVARQDHPAGTDGTLPIIG